MRFFKWLLTFFGFTSSVSVKTSGHPYRTAFVPEGEDAPFVQKINKSIKIKKWLRAMKDIIPMYLVKVLFLCFMFLLSLVSIGILYDLDSPQHKGVRVCAGIACVIIMFFCGGETVDTLSRRK